MSMRGCLLRWTDPPDHDAAFEQGFIFRPTDVVLVSYPKSGSTWVKFLLAGLVGDSPEPPTNFTEAHRLVPELSRRSLEQGVDFEAMADPRILRSHSSLNAKFPRVIYLLRDPRDVLVSLYHHRRKFAGYSGSLETFLRERRRVSNGWNQHVDGWFGSGFDQQRMHVVRYESLKADPVAVTRSMLSFVGLERHDEHIRAAVEAARFDRMRRLEESSGLGISSEGDQSIRFVRRGQVGGWKDELGPREQALVRKSLGARLGRLGYTDPISTEETV